MPAHVLDAPPRDAAAFEKAPGRGARSSRWDCPAAQVCPPDRILTAVHVAVLLPVGGLPARYPMSPD